MVYINDSKLQIFRYLIRRLLNWSLVLSTLSPHFNYDVLCSSVWTPSWVTLQREQFRCVFALGSPFLVVELYFLVLERVGGDGFVIIGAAETETELMKRVFNSDWCRTLLRNEKNLPDLLCSASFGSNGSFMTDAVELVFWCCDCATCHIDWHLERSQWIGEPEFKWTLLPLFGKYHPLLRWNNKRSNWFVSGGLGQQVINDD